ncbi:hypothetical protein KC19_VG062300 [Ceratodon purpureus]|uniref:Uncharacterized protein n=1 Tax=Ceratodon purpureus TaxID=3225 RepID=A0A8T0HMG5_CERPU|nr:hypothetical protein KC19_VG062300 [Ceratodon purpureus]
MVMFVPSSYGVKCERRDRYGGEPSWVHSVIREYEIGILGPRHNCQGHWIQVSGVNLGTRGTEENDHQHNKIHVIVNQSSRGLWFNLEYILAKNFLIETELGADGL